jgi:hypothetical protein
MKQIVVAQTPFRRGAIVVGTITLRENQNLKTTLLLKICCKDYGRE